MALIALEISDTGILAAGGDPPRLLTLDRRDTVSRGFALPDKKKTLWGNEAARQAHLFPYRIQHHFWDQLSNAPLREPVAGAENQAELAYGHLGMLWETLKAYGNEMIVAVPTYYSRHQMGLFLGMAQELNLPIRGFFPLALASVSEPIPASNLVFLDLHLHRADVSLMMQTDQLRCKKTLTLDEQGLLMLHRAWVDALAEEFVQTTRIDPLHEARSEQALYDRLEAILHHLKGHFSMTIDLKLGHGVHAVTITRDQLVARAASFFNGVRRLIHLLLEGDTTAPADTVLLLTDRMAAVPGVEDLLADLPRSRVVTLERGAGALNLLRQRHEFEQERPAAGTHFFSSRPWQPTSAPEASAERDLSETKRQPTHILWGELAYAITTEPLYLTVVPGAPQGGGLHITRHPPQDAPWDVTVRRQGDRVVLMVQEKARATVEGNDLKGESSGSLGLSIQVGDIADTVKFIACLEENDLSTP